MLSRLLLNAKGNNRPAHSFELVMNGILNQDQFLILKNYANAIEPVVDPDTTWELETKLRDINGNTIGKVTLTTGSYG